MKLLLALSSLSSLSSSTTAQTSGAASNTNKLRRTIGESSPSTSSSSSISVSGYSADKDMSGNSGSLQQQRFLSADYLIEKPLTEIANAYVQGPKVNDMWVKSSRFTTTQWSGLGWTKPGGTYVNADEIGLNQLIDFWEGTGITLGFLDEAKRDAFLNFDYWFEMCALDVTKPSFSFPISEAIGVDGSYYWARWVPDTGGVLTADMLDIATDMGFLYPSNGVYTFVIHSGNESVCPQPTDAPTGYPSLSPSYTYEPTDPTGIEVCDIKVELHIVDQTRSTCDPKVSCKFFIDDTNVGDYFQELEVRIAEVPEDYSVKEAASYFDVADPGFIIDNSASTDTCITYLAAGNRRLVTGMINVAIACGTFKLDDSTTKYLCAVSEDIASYADNEHILTKFMKLTLNDSNKSSSGPRAAKSKRAKGSGGLKRLLQEEEAVGDFEVTFPQDITWESGAGEVLYPMILTSNVTWTVDACLLLPSGHILTDIINAESNEPMPIDGACTHIVLPGEDLVLLFKTIEESISGRARALENLFKGRGGGRPQDSQDIQGHVVATQVSGNGRPKKAKTIDFTTRGNKKRSFGQGN